MKSPQKNGVKHVKVNRFSKTIPYKKVMYDLKLEIFIGIIWNSCWGIVFYMSLLQEESSELVCQTIQSWGINYYQYQAIAAIAYTIITLVGIFIKVQDQKLLNSEIVKFQSMNRNQQKQKLEQNREESFINKKQLAQQAQKQVQYIDIQDIPQRYTKFKNNLTLFNILNILMILASFCYLTFNYSFSQIESCGNIGTSTQIYMVMTGIAILVMFTGSLLWLFTHINQKDQNTNEYMQIQQDDVVNQKKYESQYGSIN